MSSNVMQNEKFGEKNLGNFELLNQIRSFKKMPKYARLERGARADLMCTVILYLGRLVLGLRVQ